jgi:hypothetical protein
MNTRRSFFAVLCGLVAAPFVRRKRPSLMDEMFMEREQEYARLGIPGYTTVIRTQNYRIALYGIENLGDGPIYVRDNP